MVLVLSEARSDHGVMLLSVRNNKVSFISLKDQNKNMFQNMQVLLYILEFLTTLQVDQ